jgi:hypothetical protein
MRQKKKNSLLKNQETDAMKSIIEHRQSLYNLLLARKELSTTRNALVDMLDHSVNLVRLEHSNLDIHSEFANLAKTSPQVLSIAIVE